MSRKLLAILILLALPVLAHADLRTGNQFVFATVSDGLGWVSWYKGNVNQPANGRVLSFVNHSFLQLKIENLYYSNNDLSPFPTKTGPPEFNTNNGPDVLLDNGTNSKIGDTIETTWRQGKFDIVQDVYPVAFSKSGQIVLKIRIVNHSTFAITSAQVEYLLDVDPQNDKAKILSRWGYTSNWKLYPDTLNKKSIPPFFIANQFAPDQTGFPGLAATGYIKDSLFVQSQGLIWPTKFIIGDWSVLSYYKWGYPDHLWNGPYGDNAILYEWPLTSIPGKTASDSTATIAGISYGTGEYCENYGTSAPIYTILMQPGRLSFNTKAPRYAPNPFAIEALVINLSATASINNTNASLAVGAPLKISSGSALVSSKTQRLLPFTIPPLDAADTMWFVRTSDTNSTSDLLANISLDVNGISWTDPWDCPIRIPPTNTDSLAPLVTTISSSQHNFSLQVQDDRAVDLGLDSISWTGTNANVTETSGGAIPIVGCSKSIYTFSITQVDTNKEACVSFAFRDCANNTSRFDTCLKGIDLQALDIHPPTFTYRYGTKLNHGTDSNNHCNFQCTEWSLLDNKQFDRGLASVTEKQFDNMSMNIDGLSPDGKAISFSICAVDTSKNGSMTIEATDSAGHVVDTSFTYCAAATAGVEQPSYANTSLRAYPNPTSGSCRLTINGTATIEVLDVLGRIVDRFTMTERREWDMSALPAGTYVVRAEINDGHVSTRILKQ
jgi:hypothetical protein